MSVNSEQVEQVKKILIPKYFDEIIIPQMEGYYSDYTVDFESKPVVKCPLHGEDTPSLRWYEDTNTFYCFGCRAGGDIINLHRKFTAAINSTEPNFEEAVNFLYGYFIRGMDSTTVLKDSPIMEEEQLSTTPQLLLLSNYIKKLEDKLHRDTTMCLHDKIKIYNTIDVATLLTSINKVNAMDALTYIKQATR